MMYKLKAFTLMELLVGMIISTIVISFCYASYTLVYKQYLSYKIVKQQLVETMELNTVLNNDLVNSETVAYNENKLMIYSSKDKKVEYDFNELNILRKENEVADTFKLQAKNIAAKFIEPEKILVYDFSFDAPEFQEMESFRFIKNYSAETIINKAVQTAEKK